MDHYTLPELPGQYAGAHPVAASTIIPEGALVALNAAGNAVPASSAVTGYVVGRAEGGVDNSAGAIGDKMVLCKRGVFSCAADATNPPTKANNGGRVWVTAPDTVSTLNTVTCRGGIQLGMEANGRVIVDFNSSNKTAGL